MNKLRIDRSRSWIFGVCSGLARRYDYSPYYVRMFFVFLTMFGGIGILFYFLLWIAMFATNLEESKIFGVCFWISEKFNLDVSKVRIIITFITFFTGIFTGILLYIFIALILFFKRKAVSG